MELPKKKGSEDWAEMTKTYETLKELAKKYTVPIIMATQQRRPPGFLPPDRFLKKSDYEFIFIDYPDVLR